ncbi:unnamed protein product [Meganyctiphanes norvegica]|uniref:Regulator of microtubule dynamics protein 1 n=1 Tax=Meganyctiphanes norvegica TaxID=48144 RepID=A0AAV2QC22_MEGNR
MSTMVVEPLADNMLLLLAFLTLLLTVVLLLMLVALTMAIIMVYMTLVSLKELRRETVKRPNYHSTGNIVCSHCSSTLSFATSASASTAQTSMNAPLQQQTEATAEEIPHQPNNVHNIFKLPSGIETGELNNNVSKNNDHNIETTSTLHYIHSTLSDNENEVIVDTDISVNDIAMIAKINSNNTEAEIVVSNNNDSIPSTQSENKNEMIDIVQHEGTEHSAIDNAMIVRSSNNTLYEDNIVNKDNNSILSSHSASITVSEHEIEMHDLVQLEDTDKSIKDNVIVSRSNKNTPDGESIASKDTDSIISSLHDTSITVSINDSVNDLKKDIVINSTESIDEEILQATVNLTNNSKQDNTKEDMNIIESEVQLKKIPSNTIISTDESDNLINIKLIKESDENLYTKKDNASKNADLCLQENGFIEYKESESSQNIENLMDLNSSDTNTKIKSHAYGDTKTLKESDAKCFETLSSNASQMISQNASSEKLMSTTVTCESLSNSTPNNIETEEKACTISVSPTTSSSNSSPSTDTDQTATLTDSSIKTFPESAVEKSQEANNKLQSNIILETRPADGSLTLHAANIPLKQSVDDISNKESPTNISITDTSVPNVPSVSVSSSSIESSTDTSVDKMQELSSNTIPETTPADDSHKLHRDHISLKISVSDISKKDSSTDSKSNESHTPYKASIPLKRSVTDINNKDSMGKSSSNNTSMPNVSKASIPTNSIDHSTSLTKPIEDPLSSLFKEADEMYQNIDYDNLYIFLKHSKIDQKNDEFLWRLGRVTWQRAMKEKDKTEQLSLHKEALEYCQSALTLNETNGSVHRWISIITDYVAKEIDVRTRVAQSAVCRDHMFRAVELNPNDGTSWYLLGFWHYCAAEMPWYQRRLAKALFSTDFVGTYQQALDFFLKGYKNNQEFYSTNVYMIGRCYQKMGHRDEAITWIRLARDYKPIRTWNDKETHEEATEKLKKLGAT